MSSACPHIPGKLRAGGGCSSSGSSGHGHGPPPPTACHRLGHQSSRRVLLLLIRPVECAPDLVGVRYPHADEAVELEALQSRREAHRHMQHSGGRMHRVRGAAIQEGEGRGA